MDATMKNAVTEEAAAEMTNKQWIIGGGRMLGPAPFLLMGIVNLSPESFSDSARGVTRHGKPLAAQNALAELTAECRSLVASGAAVLDLGGESTRPGAQPLSATEECARILPALAALREAFSQNRPEAASCPAFSADTYKADTARAALEAGATIINDISAWSFEPELKEVLLEHKPGYVLMHCPTRPADMQKNPHYADVVDEVYAFLERKLEELVRGGFPEDHALIDPGIGFGKKLEHNLALLKHIERFYTLGLPVLVGLSYKSFFGDLAGAPLEERGPLTMTATALMGARGVWAHRVHDVRAAGQALQLAHGLV